MAGSYAPAEPSAVDTGRDPWGLKTASDHELAAVLDGAIRAIHRPSPGQERLIERLKVLRERLHDGRFRLAVLGQVKRGKSTLLNALLGQDLLPAGIVPVTSIPVFINDGRVSALTLTYTDGRREGPLVGASEELAGQLARSVAEEANPRNVLGIAHVALTVPCEALSGVTLVDTPGIGSSHRHNTDTARAILPECDAALFVVSADPPITETELAYLTEISGIVGSIVFVMNKVDLLTADERHEAGAFLRRVLADVPTLGPGASIFLVSARDGLRARNANDDVGLTASGMGALEAHLTGHLASEKRTLLETAIARKAATLVAALT